MSKFKSGKTFYKRLKQFEATHSRQEREKWLEKVEDKRRLWSELCEEIQLSDQFIRRYRNYVDWFKISLYQSPSVQLLCDFFQMFDWSVLSRNKNVIEKDEMLHLFEKFFDWQQISKWKTLSIDFLREFGNKLEWRAITGNGFLTEKMMDEFRDKIYWDKLASDHYLSENFIRKHKDRFDWERISYFQNLSEEFVEEMEDYIVWNWFNPDKKTYANYSEEFKKRYAKKMANYLEQINASEPF